MLDSRGLANRYNFVYLPVDFSTLVCLNYAFVNMVTHVDADLVFKIFQGFTEWGKQSETACHVAWNDKQQGLAALLERYRNSPVMHESVPEECKPVIVIGGQRKPFPAPTQRIKAPKLAKSAL